MLKIINRINNVRNLQEFSSSSLFKKKNVIFALNGSGKTNLSRFFRKFEEKDLKLEDFNDLKSFEAQEDKKEIEFNLEFDDTNIVTESQLELPLNNKIIVYNKEFLDKNITINDFSQKVHPGKISIGKIKTEADTIAILEKEIKNIKEEGVNIKSSLETELESCIESLRSKYGGMSKTYSSVLDLSSLYNKSLIKILKANMEIQDSELKYEKVNKINDSDIIIKSFKSFESIDLEKISELLLTRFEIQEIDAKLEGHIRLLSRDWIEKGVNSHESLDLDNKCPFCLQPLEDTDIISKYRTFIESLKSKTQVIIKTYITELNILIGVLDYNEEMLHQVSKEVTRLYELLGVKRLKFIAIIDITELRSSIDMVILFLQSKMLLLSQDIPYSQEEIIKHISVIKEKLALIGNIYSVNNIEIQSINNKLADVSRRKGSLRKLIAQLNLQKLHESQLVNINKREELLVSLEVKGKELDKEKAKAPSKEKKDLIVKFLNKLINLAGLYKYEINSDFKLLLKISKDKSFDISTYTHFVSEGEKSVIAFSYFIASILQAIDKFEDLNDLTLFIDDPISSNSYNYLHGIGSILKNISPLFRGMLDKTDTSIIPQVIVLTHNLQFYNFLVGNVYKKDSVFFNMELNKTTKKPYLRNVSNSGKLSEYLTSLKRVYQFVNEDRDENVGGDIRKVLETICSFHFLELKPESITSIFGKEPVLDLKLIADDYTHTDFNNFEDPLTLESLKNASDCLLAFIKDKYNSQYVEIEKMCAN